MNFKCRRIVPYIFVTIIQIKCGTYACTRFFRVYLNKTLKCEITLLLKECNYVTHTQVKYLYFFLYSDISLYFGNSCSKHVFYSTTSEGRLELSNYNARDLQLSRYSNQVAVCDRGSIPADARDFSSPYRYDRLRGPPSLLFSDSRGLHP